MNAAPEPLLLDVARAVLMRHGGDRWVVRPTGVWCYVTPPDDVPRKHGWKLHVSATPLSAPIVLSAAAAVLVGQGCSFKFAVDLDQVAQLVSNWVDRGSGGKFITAYPRDDDHFRVLASRLDEVTEGLAGPRILSDKPLRRGSLVHSRYGAFHGERRFTDNGMFVVTMTGPDGSVADDVRKPWFAPPDWAVYPFSEEPAQAAIAPESVLLGGRFRVHRAIQHANKGGVFRATDERDGADVIVKQTRAHVGARLDGADVRDQLRREAQMLELLAPLRVTPALVALLEEQGDLFLVEESVAGEPLHVSAPPGHAELVSLAGKLVTLVRTIHRAGFVINDLKPQNLIATPAGGLILVDVEHVTGPDTSWLPSFTPHFGAPEVVAEVLRGQARRATEPSADCFSLGVTLFCVATGLAPTWVSALAPGAGPAPAKRAELLAHIGATHPGLAPFIELILGLTEPDPAHRWTLDRAEAHLAQVPSDRRPAEPTYPMRPTLVDDLIRGGLVHLRRAMNPDASNLWTIPFQPRGEPDPVGVWVGAAGGLKVLACAYAADPDDALRLSLAEAATWVDDRLFAVPRLLPGLAYGRSGTAWALFEAATLLGEERIAAHAVELAKRLPLTGPIPDVTHGLSGAGLAHLHLWAASGDEELRQRALAYAESVLKAARRDDNRWSWPTAAEADTQLAGTSFYGYAHGLAGAATFLLAAAQASRHGGHAKAELERRIREDCLEAARGAADTLLAAAITPAGVVTWPSSVSDAGASTVDASGQWCNGQAGIGGFLIRAWEATGEQRYADLAVQCAAAVMSHAWRMEIGACCGVAGAGHFLLDLAELTGDTQFSADAEHLAGILQARSHLANGLPIPGQHDSACDYQAGIAGTLGFLIRLRHGGPNPWTPARGVA